MAELADLMAPISRGRVAIAIAPQLFNTAEARNRAAGILAVCEVADKMLDVATTIPGKPS